MTNISTWKPVIDALSDDDFTASGEPKVNALEDGYAAMYPNDEPINLSAGDRSAIWSAYQAIQPPHVDDSNTYTLIASKNNPLRVTVNAKTVLEMYVGQSSDIEPDVLELAATTPGVLFVKGLSDDT